MISPVKNGDINYVILFCVAKGFDKFVLNLFEVHGDGGIAGGFVLVDLGTGGYAVGNVFNFTKESDLEIGASFFRGRLGPKSVGKDVVLRG